MMGGREHVVILNDDKTEYTVIGNCHMLRQVPKALLFIHLGENITDTTPAARNVGDIVDSTLSMEQQVTSVCRACYVGLKDIVRIRPCLSDETTKKLIIAFVISKLDCIVATMHFCSKFLKSFKINYK